LPNLGWNARHDWAALFMMRSLHTENSTLGASLGFIPSQVVVVGPVLIVFWLAGLRQLLRTSFARPIALAYLVLVALFSLTGAKSYYLAGMYPVLVAAGAEPNLAALFRAVLEKHNIPLNDVHFSVMGSDADRFKAVSAGLVDAGAASTGFMPIAEKNNVKLLVSIHDEVPNYLRFCINVSDKTLKERGDDLAHFLAAEMEAQRYALSHRAAVIALANKMTSAAPDDPRAAFVFDEVKQVSAIDPELKLPVDKLDWMQQLFVRTGNLKEPIDVKTLIVREPRERALKLVGK